MSAQTRGKWKPIILFSLIAITIILIISAKTGLWVLTAIPVGFLFGFFLEKADLCGASAFSEIILVKDWQKFLGICTVIVVSMIGFAALSALGWVKLNPKPMIWANYIVGGIAFGVGIVLAGGCVSGCLFKSGQGNLNSMAGLVGIPLGVAAVEYGPLHGVTMYLKQFIIKAPGGSSVTFSSVTGLPYGLLAAIFAVVAVMVAWMLKKKQPAHANNIKKDDMPFSQRIMTKSWKPWQAGIAIGILACFAYLSSAASGRNYPLGVTHGVLHAQLLLTDAPLKHVYAPKAPSLAVQKAVGASMANPEKPAKKVSWWLILEVFALVLGAFTSAKLSNKIKFLPRPPDQTAIAFFGGILLGIGAAIAGGCVVGNIMSGVALMSVGNVIFFATVVLANWVTTWFYLMGGSLLKS
ncbi:MAG: YeeE/YedE family protein [Desulfobacteraceae bacterium]|nr:YeeE/YedE family protein [Desulfobacteraceae bacterium]